MKKGVIQSEMLRYILIAVVTFIILTFSILVIKGCSDRRREADLIGFKSDISSSIEVIATRAGSIDRENYILPDNVDSICFLDINKKTEILETPLVDNYLFIKNSLEDQVEDNVFLLSNDLLVDTFSEEDLCFENYPYYLCVETPHSILDIMLEGLGKCATIHTNYTKFISDNKRDMDKYDLLVDGGFLVKDSEDHENYRDTLQVIPLAFVNNKTAYKQYPYLAYYGNLDDSKIETIMDRKSIDTVVIFRNNPYNEYNIDASHLVIDETLDNYLSYWTIIYDVTVVAYDNSNGALISSLFASFTNTPIIFINSSNLDQYKDLLDEKTINVIDEDDIDQNVIDYLQNSTNDITVRYFESNDLRLMNQNRILRLKSNIIIP